MVVWCTVVDVEDVVDAVLANPGGWERRRLARGIFSSKLMHHGHIQLAQPIELNATGLYPTRLWKSMHKEQWREGIKAKTEKTP